MITEKLASYYGLKRNQVIKISDSQNRSYHVFVKDIVEMSVGHYLFMSNTYFDKVFKERLKADQAFFIQKSSKKATSKNTLASQLLDLEAVKAVSQSTVLIKSANLIVASLNQVMILLVVLSMLLATVILYNLTNINVAERIRELSTFKVLGFYDTEVTLYIYRETILLSVIGIILGLFSGHALHVYLMKMIANGPMHFGTSIDLYVYFIPILAIVILLILLGTMVNHHLKKVDMLEALKSVD